MHDEVALFVAGAVKDFGPFRTVVELGSLDINGTVRPLFGDADYYTGVDLVEGPGVDVVADAAEWQPSAPVDCVVCCEVLEHAANWEAILRNAHAVLRGGGVLVVTAAGPGRGPHSAVDGNALRDGEHYENIDPDVLADVLGATFRTALVEHEGLDVRAVAVK